ncbi:MAG: MraZ protein, MraZ protein [Candidatus Gottesmanbacteria bacterium GW2011_GWA2_43_14]|uniref:Transcriptional regulator MraZ n=1 Tax=Candidatus Gottesmanbacteria bacterium GW2011_GWA2_43_14 TaxID=1618443 RepID=A0A0G1DL51_9BACT|nr:MAG: MraZ protein, MraZ protein [Candidatus Gottesmanbacteria bacterium GW2011_GWA2_43_14]
MFLGTFEPNLMEKGRLALPKKIREELGGKRLVLTIGFEKCIFGFTEKAWEKTTEPELSRPLFSDKEGRDLRRKMFADAINVELDSQGRFIIPERMMEYAGIEEQVLVKGAGDHFEIWNKNIWEEYRRQIDNG